MENCHELGGLGPRGGDGGGDGGNRARPTTESWGVDLDDSVEDAVALGDGTRCKPNSWATLLPLAGMKMAAATDSSGTYDDWRLCKPEVPNPAADADADADAETDPDPDPDRTDREPCSGLDTRRLR